MKMCVCMHMGACVCMSVYVYLGSALVVLVLQVAGVCAYSNLTCNYLVLFSHCVGGEHFSNTVMIYINNYPIYTSPSRKRLVTYYWCSI